MHTLESPMNPAAGANAADAVTLLAQQRTKLYEEAESISRLLQSQDFRKFRAFFEDGARVMQEKARNIDGLTAEQRDAYTQRWIGMDQVLNWPERQLAGLSSAVDAITRKIEQYKADDPAA